jgi:hypothetical protein
MFHVFALIIALSGQSVTILEGSTGFPDRLSCEAAKDKFMVELQTALDNSDNPEVKGKYAVAETICSTEEDMQKSAAPKPGSI